MQSAFSVPAKLSTTKKAGMRILVVEDDRTICHIIASALREELYEVDVAYPGAVGMEKCQANNYDAILLDRRLPETQGDNILRELRKTKQTPVLVISAMNTSQDRVDALNAGADDYLGKPFELPELRARVRALIRRSKGLSSLDARVGDVEIVAHKKQALVGGQPIALTPSEYLLLETLMSNRDRVVSRQEIFSRVYDDSQSDMNNALDVHMSNLRRKLGRNIIKTIRGLGYMIETESSDQ